MNNGLTELKRTVESQLELINQMESIKQEVMDTKDEIYQVVNEVKQEVKELRKMVPLTEGEALHIQELVGKKSYELASTFFGKKVSDHLLLKKAGHLRQGIYFVLKQRFNARKYTVIQHSQVKEAYDFVAKVELEDLPTNYLRLTQSQLETAEKFGDNVSVFYKKQQMDFESLWIEEEEQ